jgi:7-keto-8-aminopelargonate synthetase-like enzyme
MPGDPLEWISEELDALQKQSLRRELRTHAGRQGPTIEVSGRRLINFGANDYLGLAGDLRLCESAACAERAVGWGSGASALVTGHTEFHERLERRLAEFEATPAALVFSSGYAANSGVIGALVGRGDVVFSDAKNHASIVDGCRLSRA